MKHLAFTLFILIGLNVHATHWGTYFVYIETDYVQGPWIGVEVLEESNYRYLSPVAYEDLFGSDETEMIGIFLSRLKEQKPKVYTWQYELSYSSDTVLLQPLGKIENWPTVRNEVTATLALNGFANIKFQFKDSTVITNISDLSLPYMDLKTNQSSEKPEESTEKTSDHDNEAKEEETNLFYLLLMVSIALNILLLLLFLKRRK